MKRNKLFILSSLVLSLALFAASAGQSLALGTASLSMAGGSQQVNSSFAVPVYENSGTDSVNVVQADFSYDTSMLQFQGVNCAGSFGITAGTGANTVTCAVAGGASVTGSQLVATVNFMALAGSGSTAVTIAPTSHIYRSTDNVDIWDGVAYAAGFSFTSSVPVTHSTPVTPVVAAPIVTPVVAIPATTPKTSLVKHVSKSAAIIATKSTNKHISAWIYGSVAIIAAITGITYVFRKELSKRAKPLAKKLRKNFRTINKRLRKISLVKALQRS